jgi:hypothetical protein
MFKPVVKDLLFYSQFEYCIRFHLQEVNCLRTLDHEQIDRMIERRIAWRRVDQTLTHSKFNAPVTILSNQLNKITETTVENLHTLAEALLTTPAAFKLVVSAFTSYVYTNDLTLINTVSKLPGVANIEYSQAVVNRPKNTIQLQNPKYQWRSYFKIGKLTAEQKTQLVNFLANQPDIRISPALKKWINLKFTRTQDYFFIDYNEPAWLTMLSLVTPGLIRKTLQIIPAAK